MRKKKSVTLKDLSVKSGLSVQTVSKALRGLTGMSEESRHQIQTLAEELGYRTKDQERAHAVERIPLHPRKPLRFKMVVSDKHETFDMNQLILSGLQQKLSEYGHSIELLTIPYRLEHDAVLRNWANVHQLEYCDGVFITPMIGREQEAHLLGYAIPRLLINFPGPAAEADSVAWDVGTAIHKSVRQLLSKGHTRIMYVGEIDIHRGFVLRWQSFTAAMKEGGIPVDSDTHLTDSCGSRENWTAELIRKMRRYEPTAILCALSYNLAWTYHACALLGKRIPDDISLISLQHAENAFVPDLSRPLLMIREAGIRAAERMLWRVANPNMPYEHILLQGSFCEGSTVKVI
ncbi:LacI family transcriptional regulator [Paenibacillus mesophilus]|uniref:LacI family DNA-binding transcriptional regulator n=1 Tax=Paenibacillus mesophilus TaxID=2582849 RepID=UPI00110E4727|nr:LacI family DNA-binding transcriptional regulator [Paenibacillus mesophilus]TMV48654.1 LacI family transcriptional regulator [Paenibacillus mesophilus]